jgi:hypothetical protein
MKYTVVLPYVWQPYKDACQATWRFPDENVLMVDNTVNNLGIMRAHNMGIDKMRRDDTDWLIVLSAAIRFGEPGGLDFINQLETHPGYQIIEAEEVFGWHLIAFSRETIETVGRWDENFTPYGFDDLDYSLRWQRAFGMHLQQGQNSEPGIWTKEPVELSDMGMGHGLNIAGVDSPPGPKIFYFHQKWGRHPSSSSQNAFDHPWNDPANSIRYWPPVTIDGVTGHWDEAL